MRPSHTVLAALVFACGAAPALAATPSGAWQTFIRAGEFTDLLANADEVWGATATAGLARWDRVAQRFDLIRREPGSLASNRLVALGQDRSGRLWVATDGAGLSRRSADRKRWDLVNTLDGVPSDSVRVLEPFGDTLWIGTARGFALWNGREISGSLPDGLTISFDTTFANVSVTGIVTRGDSLWIATRRGIGLARLSTGLEDWRPVNDGLASTDVQGLASDGAAIFALVSREAYRWRGDLMRWELEPGAGVVHRLGDAGGSVLAAGESGAFRWFQSAADSGWAPITGAPVAGAASGNEPEIALSPDGRAFAAVGETLYEEPALAGAWAPHPLPEGPPGNDLLQVVLEGGRVYVSSNDFGVGRYDGAWRYWPPGFCAGAGCDTTFINARFVLGLFADRGGRKWAACWSQALDSFRDDGPTPRFTHEVISVDPVSQKRTWFVCAAQAPDGRIWFGMDTPFKGEIEFEPIGLEVYDSTGAFRANYSRLNSQIGGNAVHGIAVTTSGGQDRLWMGFDTGGLDFAVLPADTPQFVSVTSANGRTVRGLASHGDSLWMLTNSELWRYRATAVGSSSPAQIFQVPGGMPLLGVKPVATGPDGSVWVGTAAGLRAYRPGQAVQVFTTRDSPIPDDEVRAIAIEPTSGAVWLTTAGGLARFDPSYQPPPAPPRASLSARVYPNPALLTGLGVGLRIAGDAEVYTVAVYDLSGRRLRRVASVADGGLVWDGRDQDGRLVPPGIYFVRAEAGGRSAVARVVLLR